MSGGPAILGTVKHVEDIATWLAATAAALTDGAALPPIRVRTASTAHLVSACLGRYGLRVPAATNRRTWTEATTLIRQGAATSLVTTRDIEGALAGPDMPRSRRGSLPERSSVERATGILIDAWRPGVPLPSPVPAAGHRHRTLCGGRALVRADQAGLGAEAMELCAGPDADLPRDWRPYLTRFVSSWPQVRHRIGAVVAGPSPTHPWLLACLASGIAGLAGARYVGRLMGGPTEHSSYRDTAASIRLDPAKLHVPSLSAAKVLVVTGPWRRGWTASVCAEILASAGARDVIVFAAALGDPPADQSGR